MSETCIYKTEVADFLSVYIPQNYIL